MLELINLLNIARTLVERKGKLNKDYFDNFIQPMWDSFNKIHENYKISFREYAELILKNNIDKKSLIDKIHQDSKYTEDLRKEFGILIDNIPSSPTGVGNHILKEFILSLRNYFTTRAILSVSRSWIKKTGEIKFNFDDEHTKSKNIFKNMPRYNAIIWLSKNNDDRELKRAAVMFEHMISFLQTEHASVAENYYKLKKDLLK
jgi:hypothetical protein